MIDCQQPMVGPPPYSLKGRKISEVELLGRPNFSAAFSAWIDGKKKVVRFSLGHSVTSKDMRIPKKISTAGFGAQGLGLIEESVEETLRLLKIPAELRTSAGSWNLEQGATRIEIFDFVEGIEFKFTEIENNRFGIPLGTLRPELIAKQLQDFLTFCNAEGVKIGNDFQYFVTRESRVVIFDFDLYFLNGPGPWLTKKNEGLMRSVILEWADGEPLKAQ